MKRVVLLVKYELIGKNDYLNPLETVLSNRGIHDIKKFLKVNKDAVIHWSKLENIERAIDCLIKHVKGGGEVFIQVDADPQMGIHHLLY